jgi:hypothetical protein
MLRLRDEHLTWRSVDGEIIIIDRRNWEYTTVNQSGAILWPHVARGTSRRALIAALQDAYGIDEERAVADVEQFLAMLRTHDLVEGDDAAANA